MGSLIHLELYKLRTVRGPLVLLALAQLVIIAGVSGLAVSADTLRTPDAIPGALAHAGLVSLFTLVLGVTAVAGEYRNKTITDTYLSTPRRGRVIGSKVAAYAVAGVAFATVNAVTAIATTRIWWAVEDVPFDLPWGTVVGCFAWNVAFAVIGVGLGALLRNLTAAIVAALAWIALVEGIVGQLIGDPARWLPFAAGSALGDLSAATGGPDPVSQPAAAVALAAYAALFVLVATASSVRRDVT